MDLTRGKSIVAGEYSFDDISIWVKIAQNLLYTPNGV